MNNVHIYAIPFQEDCLDPDDDGPSKNFGGDGGNDSNFNGSSGYGGSTGPGGGGGNNFGGGTNFGGSGGNFGGSGGGPGGPSRGIGFEDFDNANQPMSLPTMPSVPPSNAAMAYPPPVVYNNITIFETVAQSPLVENHDLYTCPNRTTFS